MYTICLVQSPSGGNLAFVLEGKIAMLDAFSRVERISAQVSESHKYMRLLYVEEIHFEDPKWLR